VIFVQKDRIDIDLFFLLRAEYQFRRRQMTGVSPSSTLVCGAASGATEVGRGGKQTFAANAQ
jgi:hypothetical protein